MAAWTFATVWDTVAQAYPDRIALAHGDRRLDWRSTEWRAAGIAATLCGAGLGRGDKVALYLHNAPEYMEAAYAAMKAGLVPVNINYRYVADELLYLWTNADAAAVVFHAAFTATAEALRGRCPAVRLWLHVDDGSGSCPSWAQPYEQAAAMPHAAHLTSGDDQILIYTGGTTGLPRGVMWRQHDLYLASNASGDAATFDAEAVRGATVRARPRRAAGGTAHARHRLRVRCHDPEPRRHRAHSGRAEIRRGPPAGRHRAGAGH